ncbi:hypothetical protein FB45DRAFT_1068068 [Roridomyces roridus]|uniref:Uncharacterized protein n=1 Tax=Roridomyces roridus TaxID=1738132 RepID=A0AAD7B173_9AGAR|nr:hypothetical protein FB45DRAFT_1068068 [Roridomyces roridus]
MKLSISDSIVLYHSETERRAEYFKAARKKIRTWFNAQYGQSKRRSKKQLIFREMFNKPELNPPTPPKPRIVNYYSRKFYAERIEPRVRARVVALQRMEQPKAVVAIRAAVTKQAWLSETPEFRAEAPAA